MIRQAVSSVSTRFTILIVGLLLILIFVAGVSIIGLTFVNNNAQRITDRWLNGTQILGQVSGQVSEFRIAESYRVLAIEPNYESEADALANHHRDTITFLLDRYTSVVGRELPKAEFEVFTRAWSEYLGGHDRWVASDADAVQASPALAGSELNNEFLEADKDVKILIAANQAAAVAQARQAELNAQRAIALVILSACAAVTVAVALVRQVFSQIRTPLRSITAALSDLASGSLDIEVPQLDRKDEIGEMALAFEVFRNNAMALAEARKLADGLASYDALTGLANRRLFASIIGESMVRATARGEAFAVMLLDLDRFKAINDLKGHAAGDAVLGEIGGRLRAVVGDQGTVARLGGDEFAVLVSSAFAEGGQPEPLSALASAIIATVRTPIGVAGGQVDVGVSIGVASFPGDGQDAEALLRAADLAMYRAKKEGAGLFHFFDPAMIQDMEAQSALDGDLRHALRSGQIKPFFQPLVDLSNGRIAGFEILARWHHPVRGAVPPDVFVPLLERLGLSEALTAEMLRQACRQARAWGRRTRLALNVSPAEFQSAGLPSLILGILAEEGIAPSDLAIEVTETAVLRDIDAARRTLEILRDSGIEIVLDDFGTGYASLHYLKEFRFDKLKIDRSFIQAMREDSMSEKIVESVLHLARSTGIATVAEGIEDDQTLADLVRMGCDFGQGFRFSKAVDARLAEAMLIAGYTALDEGEAKAA